MQYPKALKEKVGLWLVTAPHGSQQIVAEALAVSSRTLRAWKTTVRQQRANKTQGRKKVAISFKEKLVVTREWHRQGYPGSRPVIKALPLLRVRVVREVISELKTRRRKRAEKMKLQMRSSVQVKQAGSVLTMDGASLRKGVDYIVHRDRGSLSVKATKCDGHLSSDDTLGVLNNLEEQNRLPLVLCTDNGSPFCAEVVEDFLGKKYIVHLKNLPRVPQHNGSCENAVKEFKELLAHKSNTESTVITLNKNRKRSKLNWQTSQEFEEKNLISCTEETRIIFYQETKRRIKSALIGINSAYKKRKIEREEILKTMQDFSLISITRGNQPRQFKAEENA